MRINAHHIALSAAILFYSCKPQQQVTSTNSRDSVRTEVKYQVIEKMKDTTLIVSADSSLISALVECDSLRQVQIKSISVTAGKRVTPAITLQGNRLTAQCRADSLSIYLQWRERMERFDSLRGERRDSATVVVQPRNYLTGFQWFQVWLGRMLALLLLLYAGRKWAGSKFNFIKKFLK